MSQPNFFPLFYFLESSTTDQLYGLEIDTYVGFDDFDSITKYMEKIIDLFEEATQNYDLPMQDRLRCRKAILRIKPIVEEYKKTGDKKVYLKFLNPKWHY